jgi:hypothetical protein
MLERLLKASADPVAVGDAVIQVSAILVLPFTHKTVQTQTN